MAIEIRTQFGTVRQHDVASVDKALVEGKRPTEVVFDWKKSLRLDTRPISKAHAARIYSPSEAKILFTPTDPHLSKNIETKLKSRGLSVLRFCESLGISRTTYSGILQKLRSVSPETPSVQLNPAMLPNLHKVCNALGIVIEIPTIPQVITDAPRQYWGLGQIFGEDESYDIATYFKKIMGMLREIRLQRNFSYRKLHAEMKNADYKMAMDTLTSIEFAEYYDDLILPTERMLDFFDIDIDPFEFMQIESCHLEESELIKPAVKKMIGEKLRARYDFSLISRLRLLRFLRVDESTFNEVILGRSHVSFRTNKALRMFAMLLKVHLPPQDDRERWLQELQVACEQNNITDLIISQQLGISLSELWELKLKIYLGEEDVFQKSNNYNISYLQSLMRNGALDQKREVVSETAEMSKREGRQGNTARVRKPGKTGLSEPKVVKLPLYQFPDMVELNEIANMALDYISFTRRKRSESSLSNDEIVNRIPNSNGAQTANAIRFLLDLDRNESLSGQQLKDLKIARALEIVIDKRFGQFEAEQKVRFLRGYLKTLLHLTRIVQAYVEIYRKEKQKLVRTLQ